MLIKKLVCALALAFGALCLPASAEPADVMVAPASCVTPDGIGRGTITKVGGAVLTAAHVVTPCVEEVEGHVFPEIDLAILTTDVIEDCRAPYPGEIVEFWGFPGTDLQGNILETQVPEKTVGTVDVIDKDVTALKADLSGFQTYKHQTFVFPIPNVRPGYSGGAVTSLGGEQFLGIISTAGRSFPEATFVPADVICSKMESVL